MTGKEGPDSGWSERRGARGESVRTPNGTKRTGSGRDSKNTAGFTPDVGIHAENQLIQIPEAERLLRRDIVRKALITCRAVDNETATGIAHLEHHAKTPHSSERGVRRTQIMIIFENRK